MATGTIELPPNAAVFPDGSTDNVGPGMSPRKGALTGKDVHLLTLDYDGSGSVIESAWWSFVMPQDYASGGTLRVKGMINGTTNAAVIQAQVSAVTDADADTPLEHALSTAATVTINANATEARRLISGTTALNMDSAAAADLVTIVIFRDPTSGSDTSTADFEFLGATFEYTTT